MLKSLRYMSILQWLLQILVLSEAIFNSESPANYDIKDGDIFDFVIVGAGSAGAIVAVRLSEISKFKVLLIEAGDDPPIASVVPGLFALLQDTKYDWGYRSYTDPGVGEAHPDRMIPYIRGKLLGGCSAVNYLFYMRGVPQDYNKWNEIAPGWDWESVLYYFKKLEGMTDTSLFKYPQNAVLHSANGPVKASRPVTFNTIGEIDDVRLNSYEEIGIKRVLENNGPEILGAARPHLSIYKGRRSSTYEAYIKPAHKRPNLKIAKRSLVTKILIDNKTLRAYGLEVAKNGKNTVKVYARNEIIISAGVFNSPKILMQSGIGPIEELSRLGIKTLVDLPVGKNFHDHQIIQLAIQGKLGLSSAIQNVLVATRLDTIPAPLQNGFFRLNGSESFTDAYQPHFQFTNLVVGAGTAPVVFLACKQITNFDNKLCASLAKTNVLNELDFTLLALLHPLSRGEVTLRSKDPFEDPVINLGYFRNEYDVEVTAKGLQYISSLLNTTYFRSVDATIPRLSVKGCDNIKWGTVAYWRCYAKSTVSSLQHGVGTCSMGPNGVVNERLQVHNTFGLRVIDASVIPLIPSGNTNVPVMMIGEKAADMIKADYGVLNYGYEDIFNTV